jgi:hypothetical protein
MFLTFLTFLLFSRFLSLTEDIRPSTPKKIESEERFPDNINIKEEHRKAKNKLKRSINVNSKICRRLDFSDCENDEIIEELNELKISQNTGQNEKLNLK